MAYFLLALAFVMTLLFGFWAISRLDRFLDSLNDGMDDTDTD